MLDLDAVQKLIDEASEGPWEADDWDSIVNESDNIGDFYTTPDRDFTIAARTLLPQAVEEIKSLRAELEDAKTLISAVQGWESMMEPILESLDTDEYKEMACDGLKQAYWEWRDKRAYDFVSSLNANCEDE